MRNTLVFNTVLLYDVSVQYGSVCLKFSNFCSSSAVLVIPTTRNSNLQRHVIEKNIHVT